MAETPVGTCPDVGVNWTPKYTETHVTEKSIARNLRQQRRAVAVSTGLRAWTAPTPALTQSQRKAIRDFLRARRGSYQAFYFWNPAVEQYFDVAAGTSTGASKIIIPFRTTGPLGVSMGTLTDVRIAGVSAGFTRQSLLPRLGDYACPRFDAAAGYIDCGASSTLKFAGDVTLCAWVYLSSTSGNQAIAGNFVISSGGYLLQAQGGSLLFYTGFVGGAGFFAATCTTPLTARTWTHVAAVKSGTNVTFYINGVAQNTVGSVTNQATGAGDLLIGATSGPANYFNGLITHARVYNVAVSAGEVANIYNSNASPSANLLAWLKLTDGTGLTAADSSGYGNNGTLTASPTVLWVAGEEEVSFTGGVGAGAITVWGTLRERLVAIFGTDTIEQDFLQDAADVRAIFPLAIQEVF